MVYQYSLSIKIVAVNKRSVSSVKGAIKEPVSKDHITVNHRRRADGTKSRVSICAGNERKKDVHNQGSRLPWLWTVGGGKRNGLRNKKNY